MEGSYSPVTADSFTPITTIIVTVNCVYAESLEEDIEAIFEPLFWPHASVCLLLVRHRGAVLGSARQAFERRDLPI